LFLAREFSPPEELEGNAKRLLRTANQRPVSLPEVQDIFKTSPRKLKPNLLEALNESDTACDSVEGWKFLVEEANKAEHHGNEQITMMRDCLEFFVVVEELFPDNTQSLRRKSSDLEGIVLCLK